MEKQRTSGYVPVNGLQMYYEIEGAGEPLLYLGMGFDVAGLLDHLGIGRADILGACVGGIVAMLVAIRHPGRVRRVVAYGSALGPFHAAYKPEILAGTMKLRPESAVFDFQRTQYTKVAPDPANWPKIWAKFGATDWKGFSREAFASVSVPVLIAVGDQDWLRLDRAMEYSQQIPGAELAVIPDAGHFVLDADPERLLPIIERFLDQPPDKLPFATAEIPYERGVSR